MRSWTRFLFGTPARTLITLAVALYLIEKVQPGLVGQWLTNFVNLFSPLIGTIFTIVMLVAIIRWIWKGGRKK
ncbi:MAG: hypothetical protein HY459_00895 [Parcubacteria group bacterium]|nr:hypothetical protein [Parcubacteria group bacterium]